MLVIKFGGAAFTQPEDFLEIADLICGEPGPLVVVVSAMSRLTDLLIGLGERVNPNPPKREQDMLVSTGERISMALLAMALESKGKRAISFTGSQSGIITSSSHADASIIDVRPHRLQEALTQGAIAIVAGFQGVSKNKEITTLGRGGSDTTAVALGLALEADEVRFYKDVPGMFTADPKCDSRAKPLPQLTYSEALAIGGRILHRRCLELAEKNGLPLRILSFKRDSIGHSLICDSTVLRGTRPIYEEENASCSS